MNAEISVKNENQKLVVNCNQVNEFNIADKSEKN